MTGIGNREAYTMALRPSVEDKLFFMRLLPPSVTVFADFGCADGYLLREAYLRKREEIDGWDSHYVGYDHDPQMLAAHRPSSSLGNFEFTSDFAMFAARLERHHRQGRRSCLVLSSVVHEVLSQDPGGFLPFWAKVRSLGCHYIAVRDMAVEDATYQRGVSTEEYVAACSDPAMSHYLDHGVSTPGTFKNRVEFLAGLLKAPYADKEREYAERYFALTAEQWLNWLTIGSGYKLRHFEHTPIPFLQREWAKRYGLFVADPTHVKLLLQRDAPR